MCVYTHICVMCMHTQFKNCQAVSKKCTMLVNSRGGGLTQHQWGDQSKEVMFKLWCEKTSWGKGLKEEKPFVPGNRVWL